jgi:hypothetical protein
MTTGNLQANPYLTCGQTQPACLGAGFGLGLLKQAHAHTHTHDGLCIGNTTGKPTGIPRPTHTQPTDNPYLHARVWVFNGFHLGIVAGGWLSAVFMWVLGRRWVMGKMGLPSHWSALRASTTASIDMGVLDVRVQTSSVTSRTCLEHAWTCLRDSNCPSSMAGSTFIMLVVPIIIIVTVGVVGVIVIVG